MAGLAKWMRSILCIFACQCVKKKGKDESEDQNGNESDAKSIDNYQVTNAKSDYEKSKKSKPDHKEDHQTHLKTNSAVIVIDEEQFQADKDILSSNSDYFKGMLVEQTVCHIDSRIVTPIAFQFILNFLYNGLLPISCSKTMRQVYHGAQYLGIPAVIEKCKDMFDIFSSNLHKVMHVYSIACELDLQAPRQRSLKILARNLESVLVEERFLDFTKDQVMDLFMEEHIGVKSEFILFLATLKWLYHDFQTREKYAVDIFRCINFGSMTLKEAKACLRPAILPELIEKPEIRAIFDEAIVYISSKSKNEERLFDAMKTKPRTLLVHGKSSELWNLPESHLSWNLNLAATKIQTAYRGFKNRKSKAKGDCENTKVELKSFCSPDKNLKRKQGMGLERNKFGKQFKYLNESPFHQITAYSPGLCFLIVVLFACTSNIQSVSGSCTSSQATPENLGKLSTAISELAINLHKRLSNNLTENIFFSPLSIAAAFQMLFYGTKGETAEELRNALGYDKTGLPDNLIHSTFHHLLCKLQMENNPSQESAITVANALLVDTELGMSPAYQDAVEDLYQARVRNVKFALESKAVMKEMNDWVNEKTKGKIGVFADSLDSTSVMVVLNAVYFKGAWRMPFEPERTKMKLFYNNGLEENAVQVPMMHSKHRFRQGNAEHFQVLELPYKGNSMSMLILLPRKRDGLPEFEKKLTVEFLNVILSEMFDYDVVVTLPKFKFDYSRELSDDFKVLGAVKIFDDGFADFSGLASKNAYVSGALHKAVIEVNEAGTEAAVATGIAMTGRSAPVSFVADHPFIFAVVDKISGSNVVLLIGRVSHF